MENLGNRCRIFPGVGRVNQEILTIQEVAKLLKVADKTVYSMAQRGDLPAFRVGGLWRFRRQDIDAWITERVGRARRASAPSTRDRANAAPTRKRKAGA
jgi:excisionase family DNA binding protein